MSKLTVVGSISTDFVVEVARRPLLGETVEGKNFSTSFGGKGANQAVAAARLGGQVQMVGTVGMDNFGDELIRNMEANQIDVKHVERVTHLPSGSAHIQIENGDNAIVYIAGANNALTEERIRNLTKVLQNSDIVIVQNEVPQETIEVLIEECNRLAVPLLLNPAPARSFPEKLLEKVTFLTPNESEFGILFPGQAMEEVLQKYPHKLLITMGSKGVRYHDGEQVQLVPAYRTTPVDTTGAGDTFNGAFAVAYTNGLTVEDSIRFGNLAASLSIQKKGAQGGIPTLEELKRSEYFEKEWHIK